MGIVVIGAVFVDIKGYPEANFIPTGRNVGRVEQIHGGVGRNVAEDIANVELRPTFVSLVDDSGAATVYEVSTDALYLRQVMEQAEGLTFESADGMVITVNGLRADYVLDGAYWGFFVNGDYCNYGIDQQPVEDADRFSIVYTLA